MSKAQFVSGFIAAAVWQAHDEQGDLDRFRLSKKGREYLTRQASTFYDKHRSLIGEVDIDDDYAGHATALSANRHGAGWMDYRGEAAKKLSKLSHEYAYDVYESRGRLYAEKA
jgi:hypothetical protein